jgi:ABC-type polysaccharide/polyol phosphate export permease
MLTAILCLRFRDVQQTVASVLQVLVFVTPVFWQVNQLQGKRLIIVHANPLHYMVDVVRQPLLGAMPSAMSYLVCAGCAVAGWLLAFRLLARKRHRLAYWF